jgi:hypothetical protein
MSGALQLIDPVTGAPRPAKGVDGRLVLSLPANAIAITPSDITVYDPPLQVWVGSVGDVAIVPYGRAGDKSVIYPAMPVGSTVPVLAKQILNTGTTGGIVLRGQW